MENFSADLKNQTVLVTGAVGNIGSAIVEKFARCGSNIVIFDINQEAVDKKVTEVKEKYQVKSLGFAIDISDDVALSEALETAEKEFGTINTLVNNAGVHHFKPILETDIEEVRRVFEVNVIACWNLTKKLALGMIKAGGGSIINITSAISHTGGRGTGGAPYIASKGALNSLTHASARELGQYGIRVNSVAPGYITGPFYDAYKERIDQALQSAAIHRPTLPEEIAESVAYLASSASSGTTGDTLSVNCGLVTR
ncbi:MAG: SDR family oxidoreductase [Paraglaciecola sp.]|nr:SDR family oxidoreductase [Paraglaciecola sp.]